MTTRGEFPIAEFGFPGPCGIDSRTFTGRLSIRDAQKIKPGHTENWTDPVSGKKKGRTTDIGCLDLFPKRKSGILRTSLCARGGT